MKLHLGCGSVALPEPWLNIDRRYQPGVDRLDDVGVLHHYEPASIDTIYAAHVIDHFRRWDYPHALKRWWELLKPNGQLFLSTPDFDVILAYYNRTGDLRRLIGPLYAGQEYEGNTRHVIFNAVWLSEELCSVGFRDVHDITFGCPAWPTWDDCSTAKLPDGQPFSLNVTALK